MNLPYVSQTAAGPSAEPKSEQESGSRPVAELRVGLRCMQGEGLPDSAARNSMGLL
jgi:hypothetical protein